MPPRVVVALSGGVDSSVATLLLLEAGYEVECLFMKNWEGDEDVCSAAEDYRDALQVCDRLELPLHSVNFSRQYRQRVFKHFLNEYRACRTPNPDTLCNREIKFKAFLEYALKLGADHIATGHYAQVDREGDRLRLKKGRDRNKDQSYFLFQLDQNQLSRTLFPLGELKKPQVRQQALEAGLVTHEKKDSTGICFIGEQASFRRFLKRYLSAEPGEIITVEGQSCGRHEGLPYYTLGQRKGLGIGGGYGPLEAPWYVVDKDLENNRLIVAQGRHHPRLYHRQLTAGNLHWISGQPPPLEQPLKTKIRYRQADQDCTITTLNGGTAWVRFEQPQFAITPGQAIVFYQRDCCLGGGTIETRSTDVAG